jgi:hypothetical protein
MACERLNKNTRTWQRVLFALGITLCLTGALLMVNGSIFGDRTTGIAIVTGIIGIGLIGNFSATVARHPQTKTENTNNRR